MSEINSASITVYGGKEDAVKVSEFLKTNVRHMSCHIYHGDTDKCNFVEFDDVKGDFSLVYYDLIDFCKEQDIAIDIDARYYGIYNGGYSYKSGGELKFLDDVDVMFKDRVGDDRLIEECKKRGIWSQDEENLSKGDKT